MAFPVWIEIAGLRLHPHVVFEAAAYACGFALYRWLRRRDGDVIASPARWSVIVAAAVGAAAGAKLLIWLDPGARLDPGVAWYAGKTIVGALLGGLIAVEWAKRRLGVTQRTGDLFAAPLCLGIALGRVGCFLSGVWDRTHGVPTSLPWGIDLGDGIRRHPAQLYEIVFVVALGAALLLWRRSELPRGALFRRFMLGYLSFRLVADAWKPGYAVLGLTAIQWACVAGLVYYGGLVMRLRTAGRERVHA